MTPSQPTKATTAKTISTTIQPKRWGRGLRASWARRQVKRRRKRNSATGALATSSMRPRAAISLPLVGVPRLVMSPISAKTASQVMTAKKAKTTPPTRAARRRPTDSRPAEPARVGGGSGGSPPVRVASLDSASDWAEAAAGRAAKKLRPRRQRAPTGAVAISS